MVAIEEQWRRRRQRQGTATMRRDATINDKCVTLFFDDDKDDEEDHELDNIMHVVVVVVLGNLERYCASKKRPDHAYSCRISSNDTFVVSAHHSPSISKHWLSTVEYEEQQQNQHRTSMLLSSSSLPFIGIICSVLSGDSRIKNCSSFIRIRYSFSVIPSKNIATDSSSSSNIVIISIAHGIRSTIIRQHNKTE